MSTLALVPPAPITPTRLREVVELLAACVQADRRPHHDQVAIWLGGLVDRARQSEEQALCDHAAWIIERVISGSTFRECAVCGKSFGRIRD